MTPHNNPARKFYLYAGDEPHLDKLPPHHAQAVYVIDVLGFCYEAAAAWLEIPVNTLKTRTHRARARIILLRAAAAPQTEEVADGAGA